MMTTLLDDVYLQDQKEYLCFGNSHLELTFSMKSGNWISLQDKHSERFLVGVTVHDLPSILIRVGGSIQSAGVVRNSRVFDLEDAQEIGKQTQYIRHKTLIEDDVVVLTVTTQEKDWLLSTIIRLGANANTIRRGVRLEYLGNDEVILRDVRLLVPHIIDIQGTTIEAPDYPITPHVILEEIPDGILPGLDSRSLTAPGIVQHSVDVPGSIAGLVAAYNPKDETCLLIWPYSTSEFSIMELEKHQGGTNIIHWSFIADRFTTGHVLQDEPQYMRVDHGPWDEVMERYQDWYGEIGMKVPADSPGWSVGAAIYEVHVGRAPFLNGISYEPYPTMANLVDDLPRIAGLGFDVIQIMPHWPFCGYTVHDYYQIDKHYGHEANLKSLVRLAHEMGLKVILDVVLHGCVDKEIIEWDMSILDPRYHFIFDEWLKAADQRSTYRINHPDWFMEDIEGQTAKIYTWAFDHANPSFQDYLIGVLEYYINELGVDGFRFDAPTWNCMPNWKRGSPERASAAYYASYHMLNRARETINARYSDILFYTEPSGPIFRNIMDLTYNYDEEWLSGSIMEVVSDRGYAGAKIYDGRKITAREVADWLHFKRLSLPRDSMTVHHLDSHDTFWWGELAQFRYEAFGLEATRALFAMFALMGGGIMNYVGGEKGSEQFYQEILQLRRNENVIRYGECDYLAVTSDQEMLLPLLRTYEGENAIPLINLGDQPLRAHLKIPAHRISKSDTQLYIIFDLLNPLENSAETGLRITRRDLDDLVVELPPYGVRVLSLYPIEK
jgi:glycosidase